MKIPQLRKQEEKKTSHGYVWEDNYSWIHQPNCLEILKDKNKLNPEVKKYLEEENIFTEKNMEDTKSLQKELFKEIEGRIKLEDESLKFKDKFYEYWTKTTKEGNYVKYLRKKSYLKIDGNGQIIISFLNKWFTASSVPKLVLNHFHLCILR